MNAIRTILHFTARRCRPHGPAFSVTLVIGAVLAAAGPLPAQAFLIQFNDPLLGADFYKTTTTTEAVYQRFQAGLIEVHVPTNPDLNATPTKLSGQDHPVKSNPAPGKRGNPGKLFTNTALTVSEGLFSGGVKKGAITAGKGQHVFNIGGTFRVVPEAGDPNVTSVNLLARGLMEGWTNALPVTGIAAPPTASLSASIEIAGLGKAEISSSATGNTTVTQGSTLTLTPKGTQVAQNVSQSTQQSSASTTPKPFNLSGKVPVNEDINWFFTMSLEAQNQKKTIGLIFKDTINSAANAFLVQQYVNLIPQSPTRHKGVDPFFSDSVFAFDAATGELSILHPLAVVGRTEGAGSQADEPGDGPTVSSVVDYSNFVPEVEAIVTEDGQFSTTDALLNALLQYSGIFFDTANADGTFSFTDGLLEFLNPLDRTVLATAQLTNILADPNSDMFSARLTDFRFGSLSPASSPLGMDFLTRGGELWLDPDIIAQSAGFTQTAMSTAPFSVDGQPLPEPATILIFAVALTGLWICAGGFRPLRRAGRSPCTADPWPAKGNHPG